MKQNYVYQNIILEISDEKSEKHLRECPGCREIYAKVNDTMSLLDTKVEVPNGIAEAILSRKEKEMPSKVVKLNFLSYLQISLVIAAGIFLGFILGKNADTSVFQSGKTRLHHSLIEFREVHHLNVDESTFSI